MTENQHVLALGEEALMSVAYDEETLSKSERDHFKQCVFCQQKVTQYRRTNALLHTRFYRFQCPGSVELNYYCLGTISDESRKRIDAHILDCLSCADEVQEIQQAQTSFKAFPESTPIFPASQAIRRLLATYVAHEPSRPLSREDASFVLREEAALVLRDEAPERGWPRQYQAESIDLSFHLSHALNGEIILIGIITSSNVGAKVSDFKGSKVYLYCAPGPLAENNQGVEIADPLLSTEVDGGGNLTLEPVPAGSYVMLIHLPEQEIIIGEFTVDQE